MIGSQMIKILFFASLKEQLSIDALDFPLTESMTVAQLVDQLVLKEASIDRDILSAEDVLVAVDQTVVTSDFLVRPGSEVAFFPPVTGG